MGQLGHGLRNLAKAAFKGYFRLSERDKRIARNQRPPTAWKGSIGWETDWISFCQLEIVSGKLQVHDASGPPTGGLLPPDVRESYCNVVIDGKPFTGWYTPDPIVDLPSGHYVVAAQCMQWGKDRRVSRLRVLLKGRRGQRGERVGEVCIDTAQCGACDPEAFSAAWRAYRGDAGTEEECYVSGEEKYRAVALDEQNRAVMALARSSFGDGGYPIYELVSRSSRVGAEVVFIEEKEPYPF